MIHKNPVVRKNLAMALALPPIIRLLEKLENYHERIREIIKAA